MRNGNSLDLFIGITLHDAFAAIATFTKEGKEVPIDEIADAAFLQVHNELTPESVVLADALEFANEQGALVEGIVRGFYRHVWSRLMTQYPVIVAIESEMTYGLAPGFDFMTKPDLLVEDREGNLVYLEYKSTSSKKEKWINSWDTAVQLHSSVKATEATLGREVVGVQIVGMYKGYESYGKQSSPFCYAYKKAGNPPFTQDQVQYEYKAGFRRYATWELPGGVKAWVDGMPESVLANQFPLTPVIQVNDDLVNGFFRQRVVREATIQDAVSDMIEFPDDTEQIMDTAFPQHFDQCVPSFGWECQYKKLCHGYVSDPLTEGFVPREPHHEAERKQLGLEG